jgi:catechol 2,3-dioxygenase-like lactoylglutathione lyase family enzyme
MILEGIDHVALAVRDVKQSAAWYADVLGLERRHQETWGDVPTMMCKGTTMIALFPVRGDDPKPTPDRDTIAMRHLAFRADAVNFRRAQEDLTRRGIAWEFQDHTIAHSIYFEDPDGHRLEITTYEL